MIPTETIRKICIVKPSALGDIVHSLPFLHAIRARFPAAEIHWVVARGLHDFLDGHPLIDRLWLIDKDRWKQLSRLASTAGELLDLWRGLGRERFDLAVDLSGILRSGLITAATRARYRVGFKESDEGSPIFYTDKVHGDMGIHAIDRYLDVAAHLGCQTGEIVYPMPPYDPAPPLMKTLPPEYVVMSPSAGKEANRWPAERFGELAARLNLPSVLIAGKGDAKVIDAVMARAAGQAINLAGRTTLKELIAVIARAKYFITNDTGPMHIAAALNVPVFALFGPANPVRTGPYGKIHTVIMEDLACAPCYAWKPCEKHGWRCMLGLSVDKVLAAIRDKAPGLCRA